MQSGTNQPNSILVKKDQPAQSFSFLDVSYYELLSSEINENQMVFSFFWVFCASLLNQVEHTWLKSLLYICNYERTKILFVEEILTQNFNTKDLVKFLEKR
jgi:hypothetical protein